MREWVRDRLDRDRQDEQGSETETETSDERQETNKRQEVRGKREVKRARGGEGMKASESNTSRPRFVYKPWC